ncbi:MAG: DUF4250 domain-containing protein [Lachnospiraceae bacterium]|nr:DUF4250 domain-containing protein [Lachnospiraceae bacterium]
MIPNDPVMLLSFVNLKLRDNYSCLALLCEDLEISEQDLTEKLAKIDYYYNKEHNQFI